MMDEPETTKRCCPKCKSSSFRVTEIWQSGVQWDFEDGVLDKDSKESDLGFPSGRVEGECFNCGHEWTFKNVKAMSDLLTDQ